MTNQELIQLLSRVKDAPELGGDFDVEKSWKGFAAEHHFPETVRSHRYGLADYTDYAWHVLGQHLLRPATIGLSAFAVMFGGWVATVNASFDSVPGDILYPVKLATERMQITLAGTSERRAKLHAEFASRRLREVVDITNSDRDGKDVLVQAAVDSFKDELTSANEQLVQLQISSPETAVDVAVTLEQKSEEYQAVLSQTDPFSAGGTETIAEALTAAEETNAQAIESLLVSQETVRVPNSSEHLQQNFQEQYGDLKWRIALDLGRLDVVSEALRRIGVYEEHAADIEMTDFALRSHDDTFNEAMDLLGVGGYRKAFELLATIETSIDASEEIIIELEIAVSSGAVAPAEPIAP